MNWYLLYKAEADIRSTEIDGTEKKVFILVISKYMQMLFQISESRKSVGK